MSEAYFTKGFRLEGHRTSCSFDYLSRDFNSRFWLLFMVLMGYVAPNCFIAIAYISLFRIVKKRRTQTNPIKCRQSIHSKITKLMLPKSGEDLLCPKYLDALIKIEIKLVKILIVQVVLYNMAWMPYACLVLIAQFGDESSMRKIVTPFSVLIINYISKSFVLALNFYHAFLNFNMISSKKKKAKKKIGQQQLTISNIERPAHLNVKSLPKERNVISIG